MMQAAWRDVGIVVAVRAAVSAVVLWGGFRAVSDDDFARIVHMQDFANAPALDPTGTSWLPLPFWLSGGVMMLFGTSVSVARATALVAGIVSALLVYAAARLLVEDRRGALAGALLACSFPWAARLGVATVPELPAAALSIFGLATLCRTEPRLRLAGGAALLLASLCRYEPWILAAVFAAYTAADAWGATGERAQERGGLVGALALALAGPLSWVAHNAISHGDALHFLARVAAYKRAVSGVPQDLSALVSGYPLSLLREEPELCFVGAVLLAHRRYSREPVVPPAFRRPAVAVMAMLALLSLASVRGGAPTHHVGRAVLSVWILLAVGVGAGARIVLHSSVRMHFAAVVVATIPLGVLVARPWYARLDSFIVRSHELAIGEAAARQLSGDRRAMVEVIDYGYFAVQAGTGEPAAVLLDRDVDPRRSERASAFTSVASIRKRAAELDAKVVIAHRSPVTMQLGPPIATHGPWGMWTLTRARTGSARPR